MSKTKSEQFLPPDVAERAAKALTQLFSDPTPVEIVVSQKGKMFCVICAIQLACRHPGFTGSTRDVAEAFARRGADIIVSQYPDLRPLLDAGWNKDYDIENAAN